MKNKAILKNPCIPYTIKCASEARHARCKWKCASEARHASSKWKCASEARHAHSLYHFLKSAKKRDAKCEKHATLEVHSMWTYQDQIMSCACCKNKMRVP
jgi:hypothetical protein